MYRNFSTWQIFSPRTPSLCPWQISGMGKDDNKDDGKDDDKDDDKDGDKDNDKDDLWGGEQVKNLVPQQHWRLYSQLDAVRQIVYD